MVRQFKMVDLALVKQITKALINKYYKESEVYQNFVDTEHTLLNALTPYNSIEV